MSNQNYTLLEHKFIFVSHSGKVIEENGNLGIPLKSFDEVESYIAQNIESSYQYLLPGYSPNYGRILKANQFVGVIETRSGISLEILPKIALSDISETRVIFLRMLKTLKQSPFKQFNIGSLNTAKIHIFEIFITYFCDELSKLIKKGIKSEYITKTDNSNFLKGKLKITEHLKNNITHKERFFVEFDEYMTNRIQNRIIKTTIEFLYNKSSYTPNKKRLREFLFTFSEVTSLPLPVKNLSKIKIGRQMKSYSSVLNWCYIFLSDKSIIPLKGDTLAFALFFDMNRLFEDYVAACLRNEFPEKDIKTQVSRKYLIESPKKEFKLKPDILIDESIIADTKWKLLEPWKPHNGINQSDIYQMYAYGKKYNVNEINLIYPYTPDFPKINETDYKFDNMITLKIKTFDCKAGKLIFSDE